MASDRPTILIIGASRGLGLALASEFVRRAWTVIGTVRGAGRTGLHELADGHGGQVEIETIDINAPDQIAALRARMEGRTIDMLFVNAGITTEDQNVHIGAVSTDAFVDVMITNALSPMRVIEALQDLVPADGLIGVMSSGQGSIANNTIGLREVYRGSKAALNQFMRSFAAREGDVPRAMLLLAPGWIQTALGGPQATFTIEESAPILVDLMIAKRRRPGLEFLNRDGNAVAW